MKLVYIGGGSRNIPIPGGMIRVEDGKTFEVDEPMASSLLAQDIFTKPAHKAATNKEQ